MPSPKKLAMMLTDPTVPLNVRLEVFRQLANAEDEAVAPILKEVLEAACAAKSEEQHREKLGELTELIEAMKAGPLRSAIFDRMHVEPGLGNRAQVILSDGSLASPLVPDEGMAEKMRCGDTVWVEGKGSALLFHSQAVSSIGEEARIERVLDDGNLLLSVGETGRAVYRPSARLVDQLKGGEAEPGSTVVVCQRRMMAFLALPAADGLANFKYLSREPVPDVVPARDIGSPPRFIAQLTSHLRRELADPSISDRYRLRRSKLILLSGIPGSGKTYGIQGFWNQMFEIVSQATGVPVEDLPPRVMRLKSSGILSKWFGESDRKIARFFREVDQLAAEEFVAPDGRKWKLPVLVIAEEIDALARSRGEDGVHDRILATLLEGLDPSRPVFRDHMVFVIATTNTSHLVDTAIIRRIGGRIESFGHMDRFSFRAVLAKLLRELPFGHAAGSARGEAALEQTIADTTAWLYSPNSVAAGQVEITYVGQANPTTRHHRHFMTAGLVDRAVQEACEEAANSEHEGAPNAGLTTPLVTAAIHRQVRHIVDLLSPMNCGDYLTLPDGERVASVRRIEQPVAIPFEFESESEREGKLERAS